MRVKDVMATDVVTVGPDIGIKEAARLMVETGVSGLPVVENGELIGMITESDFLEQEADKSEHRYHRLLDALVGNRSHRSLGDSVRDAMTPHPITISPDARLSEAAHLMKNKHIKRLPVVGESGRMRGIVSRADILHAFIRSDEAIESQIRDDVVRRILLLDGEAVGVDVSDGVVTLTGNVPTRTEARLLEELSTRIDGVIRVTSDLGYDVDDTIPPEDHGLRI
jgi:CBS domain-containing protein